MFLNAYKIHRTHFCSLLQNTTYLLTPKTRKKKKKGCDAWSKHTRMHNRFRTRAQIPLGKAGRKNNNINIWQCASGLCQGKLDFSSIRTGLSWGTFLLQIRSKIKVPSESVPGEASFRRNPNSKESNCFRGAGSSPSSDFV